MEQGFIDILQKLIAEQGKETLLNASKCKAFLADYTKNEYKKESRLLLQALEAGVQRAVDTTNELDICKKQQVRLLHEDYGLDEGVAADIVNTLALVLRDEEKKTKQNNCKHCGKEMQEEWKVCPYCGTSVESQAPEKKPPPIAVTEPVNNLGYDLDYEDDWDCEMVYVPGGSFQMGDTAGGGKDDERPVHTVMLSAFSIGKYEVMQAQYQAVMGNNPSSSKGGNLPVECVSWYDAVEFCNKLSEMEGFSPCYTINKTVGSDTNNTSRYDNLKWLVTQNISADGYRLPTEAEWEYAAKGGNGSPGNYKYAGSNDADSVAWYGDNSGKTIHAVGTKAPNGLGIYDMSGNVWEWCWDWYGDYSSGVQTNPAGASSGSYRVFRGGSWINSAQYVRSAYRNSVTPSYRDNYLSFRVLRPAQ